MSSGIFNKDDELVLPFVVCKSMGGPYDDASYIAGWEAGSLYSGMSILSRRAVQRSALRLLVHSDNIPQLDLVAMCHGYTTETEPGEDGLVSLTVRAQPAL